MRLDPLSRYSGGGLGWGRFYSMRSKNSPPPPSPGVPGEGEETPGFSHAIAPPCPRRSRGFTLLELLIAITIAALIAGSLYSGLRIGFRAQSNAESSVEPIRTAELAMGLLRPDIESAVPANGVLRGAFIATDSTGEGGLPADTVEFFTTGDPLDPDTAGGSQQAGPGAGGMSALSGGGGAFGATQFQPGGEVRKVAIGVVPGPRGQMLVRRVTANLLAQVEEQPYEEVVCRGVRSLNLRYWDGLTWQDNWDSTTIDNNIPSAVEVTIELEREQYGQPTVLRFIRVFRLSCSTLTAQSLTDLMNSAASGTGTTGGTQ
jgi:prepilin-type N-terminal cleavage/methylation domain-containing protein